MPPVFPFRRARRAAGAWLAALVLSAAAASAEEARNILLFIADGASWGAWDAASYHEYGETGRQPYDGFEVKLGMTTRPAGTGAPYDPGLAWSRDRDADGAVAGYDYLARGATDSAAAATALSTGETTLNGRIGLDPQGAPLGLITEAMKAAGKATGTVTTVPYNHATPAAFGARNMSRGNYVEIGDEMIHGRTLDVIMGGGHPGFDASGRRREAPDFTYVSEATWAALRGEDPPRRLIESGAEIADLAAGGLEVAGPLLVLPRGGATLQLGRRAEVVGRSADTASGRAAIDGLPSLATLTTAALQVLSQDPDGLFLMVEGGAVDWAAHAHDLPGLIEEMTDFNRAVAAGIEWVEARSSWEETLVVVLTDHGNGLLMGPEADAVPFQPVRNNGAGALPGVSWQAAGHTAENTLLRAQGAGARHLSDRATGRDPHLAEVLGFNDGAYLENRAIAPALRAAAGIAARPAP